MKKILQFFACQALVFTAGALGSLATTPNIPIWYESLNKPPLNPPNWIFAPVWSILYVLIGISLFLIIRSRAKDKTPSYILFGSQLALNTLWSLVFFGLRQPATALIVIIGLIASIILYIFFVREVSKTASKLFLPYLLWVSFATYLNISIIVLNK